MTSPETKTRYDYAAARRAMIDSQLRPSGVNATRVLSRMNAIAREDYVPDNARGIAYMDRSVPLGDGKFLPPPLFHGMMLEEARPLASDTVCIVSKAGDYLADLIRPLVAHVEIVSLQEALEGQTSACSLLLIDGAVEHVPDRLAQQVQQDGRAVLGIVQDGVTRLGRARKAGDALPIMPLMEMGIPRLPEFDKPKGWQF